MNSDTVLDYAQFQLSPRRTRCALVVSGGGKTEKLASGFLKPFLTHLKVAEEQADQAVQSIKLDVEKRNNAGTWFNKGTLERFVRFVSTPEVLETVNIFDVEMAQLEGARKIYSQGSGDNLSEENDSTAAAAADITKKELLRAIDVRLAAVKQDLATACARASSAGFTLDTVTELLLFADRFGAFRLNEACTKFFSLCQRRPELISNQQSPPPLLPTQWKGFEDANVRSSSSSDMSIDDPEVDSTGPFRQVGGNSDTRPKIQEPTSGTTLQSSSSDLQCAGPPYKEKDMSKTKEDQSPNVASSDEPVQPAVSAGSRRLSVQDRINLFESKQKEQSTSASITSSSGGTGINKIAAGKGEHRRLPSDASMEKSVLRRWSGASDMSIDLSNNNSNFASVRKDSGSAVQTPASSGNSEFQSGSKTEEGTGALKDTATSCPISVSEENSMTTSTSSLSSSLAQPRSFRKARDWTDDALLKEGTATVSKTLPQPHLEKGHIDSQAQFGISMSKPHQGASSDEKIAHGSFKPAIDLVGDDMKGQAASMSQFSRIAAPSVGKKHQAVSQLPSKSVPATQMKADLKDQTAADIVGTRGQASSGSKFKTSAGGKKDGVTKSNVSMDSQFQSEPSLDKVVEIAPQNNLHFQSQLKAYPQNQEVGRKDGSTVSYMSPKVPVEDGSGSQRIQLHGSPAAPDQIKKVQGRRDGRLPHQGTSPSVFSAKKANEQGAEVLQVPATPPVEQAQVARSSRGTNDLNDELQMKADELEKLFAAHKLRVHVDQTSSSRRSKIIDSQGLKTAEKRPAELPSDQFPEPHTPTEISSSGAELDTSLLQQMVDNLDSANSMKQRLGTLSPSDDSRGKLYEKYMQKRDAKLREEWRSKKAQKEANMKAMRESLERSQAEMKAKLVRSADKQDSSVARRRAEKMRSFNVRSAGKAQGQTVHAFQGEGEDLEELGQDLYGHDRSQSDTLSGNESSTSSKKLVSSKSLSSSTLRSPATVIPKPSAKATNPSIRRRIQPENPLAQSVPNFSDLRKENTKPVSGVSKVTSRAQAGNSSRSRSGTEEAYLVKEEKSQRPNSLRKSLVVTGELKDLLPFNSDGANLATLKLSTEQIEQRVNMIQKGCELKPFLNKGDGLRPSFGTKLDDSMDSEALVNEEDSEVFMDQLEVSPDMVENLENKSEITYGEGNDQVADYSVGLDSENGEPGPPGLENGSVLRSLSQDAEDSIPVSSKFSSCRNPQDSTAESPGSWNSNIHPSFSYAHEASDLDASVESPTGSPASWNSHPLNHLMEADAARMRKKWGTAQIPVLAANTSHHPRKDVTRGFKRLLKFGRKSRGADYLVNDWVSASTASEGDDDTEDGRELGSRTSDELRKSRMGHSAYDGFNDTDTFPEHVQCLQSSFPDTTANFKLREELSGSSMKAPRSFFSLSTFRSKGSEAKPR